jgi:hypothetical protein
VEQGKGDLMAKEDMGYCLFCNEIIKLTKGRDDGISGLFVQAWIIRIEIEDCFGLKQVLEGKGSMFLCHSCREKMHQAIENNARLALDGSH